MRPHVVVAVEHSEAVNGGWNAHGGKARVPGGGVGTAVIHGRGDGDSGWHFVIEQAAHFLPEVRCNLVVGSVVASRLRRVDAAGEIAFERIDDGDGLFEIL